MPHGKGVMKYKKQSYQDWQGYQVSCKEYKGEWEHGAKSGKGKMEYYQNGRGTMEYDGEWLNDMRDGHGQWRYGNGDVVECEWKCGNKNGKGIFTFADGGSFQAEWKDNKMQMDTVTITAVDDEKVSYLISSDYVDCSFPVSDSIASGEKKKYSYTKDAVAKVYDEEYDYTIENSIEIECK